MFILDFFLFIGLVLNGGDSSSDVERRGQLLVGQQWRTFEIEWTLSHLEGLDTGLVERFRTQGAGEAVLQSNFGDENGFHETVFLADFRIIGIDAAPEALEPYPVPKEENAGTRNMLLFEGEIWELPQVDKPLMGFIRPRERAAERPLDFALLGLIPTRKPQGVNPWQLFPYADEGLEGADYVLGFQGAYRTVSAVHGDKRLTWWFDDRRGGHPVRAMLEHGNQLHYSETDWQESDGHSFPSSVRFYRNDALQPYKIIEVQKASFNKEWHKQELDPADIGAAFGTQFKLTGKTGHYFWDGLGLIPSEDYWELVYGYGILPDEKVIGAQAEKAGKDEIGIPVEQYIQSSYFGPYAKRQREIAHRKYVAKHGEEPPWLTAVKTKEKDEWDVFVEKYVAEHKFDKPRKKRAEELLKRAKQLRDYHRRRNSADIRRAEREGDQRKLEHFEKLTQRIFDTVLLRGLEALKPSGTEASVQSVKPGIADKPATDSPANPSDEN